MISDKYIRNGLPCVDVEIGTRIIDIIVKLGFATSLRHAKQLIKEGAVKMGPYRNE